jgi:hypothetical protein
MDLSGVGLEGVSASGTSPIVEVNELMNITNAGRSPTAVVQSFGADGILNDGDAFIENGSMQQLGFDGNAIFFQQTGGAGPGHVYFSYEALIGVIVNYDDGGDGPTTIANYPSALANDQFNLIFAPGAGSIKLFADTDLDPGNGTLAELADLSLIAATGIAPELSAGAVPNGTFDLAMGFNSVLPGVFSFEPNFAGYLGLADVNAGVIGIGDDGTNLLFNIENSGTFRAIPIPSTLLLLGGGLISLLGIRRKRVS